MKLFNNSNKKINLENIVLNSSDFIKSLNLSDKPDNKFVGYTLYLKIVEGIEKFNESKAKTSEYIKDAVCNSFNLSTSSEYNKTINRLQQNKRIVGNITIGDVKKNVEFTIAALIKRWMELQDNFLIPTFKETMNYSDTLIEQINNSLTPNELKLAENILFNFYEDYLMGNITGLSLDEITRKEYELNYTSYIPFKKYSYTQLINDRLWTDKIYTDREPESDYEFEDDDEDNDLIEVGDEKVREKLDSLWGNSLNEVGNRNWDFYSSTQKNKIIKYPILEIGIFNSLNKYTYELEVFKNTSQQKVDFLVIFDNHEILDNVKKYHGRKKYKYLIELIDSLYNYGTSNIPTNS